MATRHAVATRLVLLAAACHLALGADRPEACDFPIDLLLGVNDMRAKSFVLHLGSMVISAKFTRPKSSPEEGAPSSPEFETIS